MGRGRGRTAPQRTLVAATVVLGSAGFFPDDPQRQGVLVVGLLLLLVPGAVSVPRPLAVVVQRLANASLWIYLTHWQVYPPLEDAGHPVWALLASLVVGIAAWALVTGATRAGRRFSAARSAAR